MRDVSISKALARWLRHRPDAIGLSVDRQGWADIGEILEKAAEAGFHITHEELLHVVALNDKQRFALSHDRLRIRASQGHSFSVDLKLIVRKPPPVLYHGTFGKALPGIRKLGLIAGTRQCVHLSANVETALAVGGRRGVPVVLTIDTHPLVRDGFQFRCSENGVWLVDHVPPQYVRFPAESGTPNPSRRTSNTTTGRQKK